MNQLEILDEVLRLRVENAALRAENQKLLALAEVQREHALGELQDALQDAATQYEERTPSEEELEDFDTPHPQREAVARTLGAVIDFVRPQIRETHQPYLRMLHSVLAALADVDAGTKNVLFAPRKQKKGGRARTGISIDTHRATAAAAMTLLMEAGWSEQAAAMKAARTLAGTSSKALQSMRDKIEGRPLAVRELYKRLVDHHSNFAREDMDEVEALRPEEAAEMLLGMLNGENFLSPSC